VMSISLDPNTNFDQTIVGSAADNYIGDALRSARHLSFSAVVQNLSAQGIQLHVIGYSDTAGTVPVFDVTSAVVPQGTDAQIVSGTFAIGAADVINHVKFRVVSSTPGNACQFALAGTSFNAGMPISVTEMATLPVDFLSRDGGAQKQMRGHLYHGGFQAKNAADATAATDLTTLQQVTAAILVETNRALAAETVLQTNITTVQTNLNAETARAIAAEATKQDNAIYDGTPYISPILDNIGNSVKLNVAGTDRFVPSWPTAAGPCHSNCHSNCNHSDCGRGSW